MFPAPNAADPLGFSCSKEEDSHGGDRVVITFNGEFLPFMEQTQAGANDFGDEDSDEDSDEDDDDWYNY